MNNGTNDKLKINQYIARTAIKIMAVLAVFIGLFLSYESIRLSYYSSRNYNESIFEMRDSTFVHIFVFILICVLSFVLERFLKRFDDGGERVALAMLFVSAVWITVLSVVFLWEHPYTPAGDQLNIVMSARLAADGDYTVLCQGGLMGMCPQNKGMMFFYEILYRITGDAYCRVGAFIHILYELIILVSGYFLLKSNVKSAMCRILYAFFMMLCAPLIIYLPYIYGDLGAICFTMVLFYAILEFEKKLKWRYAVMAVCAGMLALLFRMNTWVVMIAVVIGLFVSAAEKKNIRPVILALCIVSAAAISSRAVEEMYDFRSGYDNVDGIPSILYIAMGLQETDRQPGVYNHYHQTVFVENDFDVSAAKKEGFRNIKESMENFKNNPGYAKYFFLKKLRMQWTEPTFEAFYATNTIPDGKVAKLWLNELYYGKPHDIVWKISNYYQSIIYISMLALMLFVLAGRLKNTKADAFMIPMIAVVGGFLFSIIWENQSRYVMPYYVFLVMYAPVGLYKIVQLAEDIFTAVTRRTKGEETGTDSEKAA